MVIWMGNVMPYEMIQLRLYVTNMEKGMGMRSTAIMEMGKHAHSQILLTI